MVSRRFFYEIVKNQAVLTIVSPSFRLVPRILRKRGVRIFLPKYATEVGSTLVGEHIFMNESVLP